MRVSASVYAGLRAPRRSGAGRGGGRPPLTRDAAKVGEGTRPGGRENVAHRRCNMRAGNRSDMTPVGERGQTIVRVAGEGGHGARPVPRQAAQSASDQAGPWAFSSTIQTPRESVDWRPVRMGPRACGLGRVFVG